MKNLLLPACLLLALAAAAQCPPQILNCPAAPQSICDSTDNNTQLWNDSGWWDPLTGTHNLAEGPANLCLTVLDTCAAGNFTLKYTLFLDLDLDGTPETIVDSDSLPGWNAIFYNNAAADSLNGGTLRPFDERPVSPEQKYGFALQTITNGDTLRACVRWNTEQAPGGYVVPELPYGAHRIVWTVLQNGSAVQICSDTFTVADCAKPEVVCFNSLSVNIMPTAMVLLWDTDFLQYAVDNATPSQQIKIGVRRSGTGSGFPLNPDGTPQHYVVFTCDDLGTNLVELWAMDLAGNTDYCETYVIVTDNLSNCVTGDPGDNFACVTSACSNMPMEGVAVEVQGASPALPPFLLSANTGPDGCIHATAFPLSKDYSIVPYLDTDPLNGVSTFDLVLINKHILGVEPLNNPYKILAADANDSRSITTFDVIELRKLILGFYTDLPNSPSWRFVPKDFVFPNVSNPFQTPVPANVVYSGQSVEFLGIKVGDVNCNASLNNFAPPAEDRTLAALTLPDLALSAGQSLDIPLGIPAGAEWLGFQFALQFDADKIGIENIAPGNLSGLDGQSYGQPRPGVVTASWFDAWPQHIAPDQALMTFRVRAKSTVRLAEAVRFLPQQLRAEAYTADERAPNLQLLFVDPANPTDAATIFAPQPNPTTGAARIPVHLAVEQPVRLELYDMAGRLLLRQESEQPAGLQWIDVPASALGPAGVYTWRVRAGQTTRSGKLVRL